MMYRDDLAAAQERIGRLEDENEHLRARLGRKGRDWLGVYVKVVVAVGVASAGTITWWLLASW